MQVCAVDIRQPLGIDGWAYVALSRVAAPASLLLLAGEDMVSQATAAGVPLRITAFTNRKLVATMQEKHMLK